MSNLNASDIARLDALKKALTQLQPQIIRGANDFARLNKMAFQGQRSKVRRILEKRASEAVTYWMRKMGARRGRPRVHNPVTFRLLGIYKKRKGLSWNELLQRVNPELFKDKATRNTLQTAVRRAEEALKIRQAKP